MAQDTVSFIPADELEECDFRASLPSLQTETVIL